MMVMMWSRMEEILVKRFSGRDWDQLPVATPRSKSLGKKAPRSWGPADSLEVLNFEYKKISLKSKWKRKLCNFCGRVKTPAPSSPDRQAPLALYNFLLEVEIRKLISRSICPFSRKQLQAQLGRLRYSLRTKTKSLEAGVSSERGIKLSKLPFGTIKQVGWYHPNSWYKTAHNFWNKILQIFGTRQGQI